MCLNVESSSCDTLCCAAYIYSSAGYKMSRQPTLGKFGFFSMYMLLNFSESQPRRSDKKVIIKKVYYPPLISRDLLKQRHMKKQERFIASRRFGVIGTPLSRD